MSAELETQKYRLIFLPEKDFQAFMQAISPRERSVYGPLLEAGIENFSTTSWEAVYIPDRFKDSLMDKAKKGEQL